MSDSETPWSPTCDYCNGVLLQPGAVILHPPHANRTILKEHRCVGCFSTNIDVSKEDVLHAIHKCGCVKITYPEYTDDEGITWGRVPHWPFKHTDAIKRLEDKCYDKSNS